MLHELGAGLCEDLKMAISSSPLAALAAHDDVLAGVDACPCKPFPLLTLSCARGIGSINAHRGFCYLCRVGATGMACAMTPFYYYLISAKEQGVSFQRQGITTFVAVMFQAFNAAFNFCLGRFHGLCRLLADLATHLVSTENVLDLL